MIEPLLLLAALAGGASAAEPAPLAADASLVRPYSYERQRREPFRAPFYAYFRRGAKELYFVAAAHGTDPGSPTFRLIRAISKKHPPDASVIEGVRADLGVSPASLTEGYRKTSGARSYKWGEAALTALLAADRGKDYLGSEPSDAELLKGLKDEGRGVDDLLGFYFLRQIPWMRRDGSLKSRKTRELFDEFMRGYPESLGLKPEERPTYDRFLSWYRRTAGKDFDPAAMEGEALAPLENGDAIQKLSAAVDLVRNRFMVDVIARTLRSHDRVLVVFGASHLTSQREAIEAMLGRPVEQSDKLEN